MKQPNLGYADVKLDFACMQAVDAVPLYVNTTISVRIIITPCSIHALSMCELRYLWAQFKFQTSCKNQSLS